ncbi:hypothetical protein [Paenibacillus roseipurpureus]|uniref:Uncharacterized protein n=1 Tax=Paenibacillus roseopurpureus TaxID=2918901 RepID=A0AA96RNP8_9BACL|nr:hypothetical protein [Paenibacillus sp. MBLB1832]WNR45757.1 hypothetical protein MJB10_06555 [Paenibacillus sp. MBLB1832]
MLDRRVLRFQLSERRERQRSFNPVHLAIYRLAARVLVVQLPLLIEKETEMGFGRFAETTASKRLLEVKQPIQNAPFQPTEGLDRR